jgi:hypothetical protein
MPDYWLGFWSMYMKVVQASKLAKFYMGCSLCFLAQFSGSFTKIKLSMYAMRIAKRLLNCLSTI